MYPAFKTPQQVVTPAATPYAPPYGSHTQGYGCGHAQASNGLLVAGGGACTGPVVFKAATVLSAPSMVARQPGEQQFSNALGVGYAGGLPYGSEVLQHHRGIAVPPLPAPAVMTQQLSSGSVPSKATQNLPRFQPPSFEGLNGLLPTPDSPGSTPRSGSCDVREASDAPPSASGVHIYPIGGIVEYNSRSSGQWIVARVKGYDEATKLYRLDVQPHAHPERVRPRQAPAPLAGAEESAAAGPAGAGATTAPAGPFFGGGGGSGSRSRTGLNDQFVTPSRMVGAPPIAGAAVSLSVPRLDEATEAFSPRFDLRVGGAEVSVATATTFSPGGAGSGAGVDMTREAPASTLSNAHLLGEVQTLRARVRQLEADNDRLQDKVAQETALKDRYFQELRMCHEQLQWARSTTPR